MEPSKRWYRLDNAAKMIPGSARGTDTKVFRLSCELSEEIDPVPLQQALEQTIREFPHFNCVMKRGLFWYYLEQSSIRPVVTEESLPALAPIYRAGRKNLLYRICYYRNRISFEVYHVLADGTGAFTFFRHLLTSYLHLIHDFADSAEAREQVPLYDRTRDAFDQYYTKGYRRKQLKAMATKRAFRIHGETDPDLHNHLIEATVSASRFIQAAKRYDTTAGVLMTALYIEAALRNANLREKRPVVISIPVNLRQYFQSDTTRNFFGVITAAYPVQQYDGKLESILAVVKKAFQDQLDEKTLRENMSSYAKLEHNVAIRVVPLFLKDLGIQFFYFLMQHGVTATISNLGRITLPEELCPYVEKFSVFMTSPNPHMCVCSYGDNMVFGGVSPHTTNPIMAVFLKRLVELGIPVEVASNDYDILPERDNDADL